MIRIGSDGRPAFHSKKETPELPPAASHSKKETPELPPAAHTLQTSPARRISITSGSSSPDSLSSGGGKFSFEGARVPRSANGVTEENPTFKMRKTLKVTASDGTITEKKRDLTAINRLD